MSETTAPPPERIPDIRRFRVTTFAVGLVAGAASALLGIGGGLIMVPAMALLLHIRQHRAVGTSLAVIIPTALVAALQYHAGAVRGGHPGLQVAVLALLAVGGVGGGVLGAVLANALGAAQLRRAFGWFVILTGVAMIAQLRAPEAAGIAILDASRALTMLGMGVFVGAVSGLLGVGGGLVMVPALVLILGYPQHLAQGTSLAVIVPVSLSGTVVHAKRGNVVWPFAFWLTAGAILGAYLTAGAVYSIPRETLRVLFGVFMVGIGLTMAAGRRPAERPG